MKIDRSFLPATVSTDHQEGLYAEFHSNGHLALFANYVDGEPKGWVLHLHPRSGRGWVERRTITRFPDPNEDPIDDHTALDAAFQEWAERWIGEIVADAHTPFRCAFCGKGNDEVAHLINGPTSAICNECVVLCTEILADNATSADSPADRGES